MTTCTRMREQMLEAELPELVGDGVSPLARHVRECAACRTLGRTLVADTNALARLVAFEPVAAPPERVKIMHGLRLLHGARWFPEPRAILSALPIAATILAVLFWQPILDEHPAPPTAPAMSGAGRGGGSGTGGAPPGADGVGAVPGTPPSVVDATEARAAIGASPDAARPSARATRAAPPLAPLQPVRTSAAATSDAPPAVSTRAVASAATDEPSGGTMVGIAPASGSRALVMRTRDPAVTVVWLY